MKLVTCEVKRKSTRLVRKQIPECSIYCMYTHDNKQESENCSVPIFLVILAKNKNTFKLKDTWK